LGERITARADGYYRCNQCKEDFTVRTNTIFERSHIPLHKWIYAVYLVVTARKGISSMQLAKEIGITQKSAWFMLGRLHEACGENFEKLQGPLRDETFVADAIARREAVIGRLGDAPAAFAVLQNEDPPFWPEDKPGEALYVHRLCLRRRYAGQGYSAAKLDWCGNEAALRGCTFLKLDCGTFPKLMAVYENAGFQRNDAAPFQSTGFVVWRYRKRVR
jgi:GNAT superfamily N-acetyltransferase